MTQQRTVRDTITFRHPFILHGFDEPLPAGTYTVETFEELIEGLSFNAYRRVETLLHLNPPPGQANLRQVIVIDPVVLEEARQRDVDGP
jgi:hypothetical protein